ncbi:hypothetical protein HAX54_015618, partial [Datura stramonium]|nr:hypothetical protein [Datura stramonium]
KREAKSERGGTGHSIVMLAEGVEGDGEVWWLGEFRWRWWRRSAECSPVGVNGGVSGGSLVEREKRGVSMLVRWFHRRNIVAAMRCWPERKKTKGKIKDEGKERDT